MGVLPRIHSTTQMNQRTINSNCRRGPRSASAIARSLKNRPRLQLLVALLALGAVLYGQTLTVDVPVVLVNTTVSDMKGHLVAGLERQNFRIWEDDVEQKVEYFSLEDMPLSIGLVFDTTGSMADKLSAAREAATAFLKTSNPRDEYFLIEFGDQPKLVQDFTTDIPRLQKQIFSTL